MLARIPAAVRFVSAEPLLERVDLSPWLESGAIRWVIVGGESGPKARPMDIEWARDLRDQSNRAGVAFFFKQWGGRTPKSGGRLLDGHAHDEFPLHQPQSGSDILDNMISGGAVTAKLGVPSVAGTY